MYRHILVPLDGSEQAEDALPVARRLAEGTSARVTLFTATRTPRMTPRGRNRLRGPVTVVGMTGAPDVTTIPAMPGVQAETRDQAIERREHELLEALDEAAAPLKASGITVDTAVAFNGGSDEIIEFARKAGCDLIVVAAHGKPHLRDGGHSVAERVIKSGVAPVVVVHGQRSNSDP